MDAQLASEQAAYLAWEDGYGSFYDGATNPHSADSDAAAAWDEGWRSARSDDRECREAGLY